MRDLGSNIYSYRKMNNLSQEDLAVIVGVSAGAVSKWERGISVPDIDILIRLADYFEISQSYISRIEKKILDKMKLEILKLA